MRSMAMIAEGKTKKIWKLGRIGEKNVLIQYKSDITAGDGARHDIILGKGKHCNRVNWHISNLLNQCRIPNHFISYCDANSFWAQQLVMIHLEVIIRGVADGSYVQRTGIERGTVLNPPVVEINFKCDQLHDPLLKKRPEGYILYDAHKPEEDGFIGELGTILRQNKLEINNFILPKEEEMEFIIETAREAFICIETAWARVGVEAGKKIRVKDMKLEFGYPTGCTGEKPRIGDGVEPDGFRIEIDGEEKSKEVYRKLTEITPEGLELVRKNYEELAELSAKLA